MQGETKKLIDAIQAHNTAVVDLAFYDEQLQLISVAENG